MTDDLQAVKDISDRDELAGQLAAVVEQAHAPRVTGVAVEVAAPAVEHERPTEADLRDLAAEAQRRAESVVLLRALARTVVSLAAELGGHDPRYNRPADAVIADNIEQLLIATHDAKSVELPLAFRQGSARDDLNRAHSIGNVIGGARG